jgi:hypothetical protein
MQNVWVLASLWVGLALVATLLAIWFKISTALTEIVVGTVAQLIFGAFIVQAVSQLRANGSVSWPEPGRSCSLSWLGPNSIPRSSESSGKSQRLSAWWGSSGRSLAALLLLTTSCIGQLDRVG